MGNCLGATMRKRNEESDSIESPRGCKGTSKAYEEDGVKQIKIKINKKQLEELLSLVDVQGLMAQQALAHLLTESNTCPPTHRTSWRPALHSIPEVSDEGLVS